LEIETILDAVQVQYEAELEANAQKKLESDMANRIEALQTLLTVPKIK
jgi:hypothetical protein